MNLIVFANGYLKAGDKLYRAACGRNGIGEKTRDGDGVSPEGTWPLRRAFYRPDRLSPPVTRLPIEATAPDFAWCDVVGDPRYNQFVRLPHPVRDEKLWRDLDSFYDLVVVLGYNDAPVIDGKGSAIFLHVARPDYSPSAGCACVSLPDLLEIMPHLDSASTLTFTREEINPTHV